MSKPNVTVVIPTFNRCEECKKAVGMVLGQSYRDFSLVVVVDGSTDGTAPALADFRSHLGSDVQERFKIIIQENRGVSAARNTGIRSTSTPLIALLDDDDSWPPDKLEKQLAHIEKFRANEAILCTTDFACVQKLDGTSRVMGSAGCSDFSHQLKLGYFPPPSTWIFSRTAFDRVGGFDELVHAGEDVDFVTMLRRINAEITNLDRPLAQYFDSGPTKSYWNQELSAVRVLRKHGTWWRQVLTIHEFSDLLVWYRSVLSRELFDDTCRQLSLQKGTDSCRGRTPGGHEA